jgi:Luciferase-like monooxygenase
VTRLGNPLVAGASRLRDRSALHQPTSHLGNGSQSDSLIRTPKALADVRKKPDTDANITQRRFRRPAPAAERDHDRVQQSSSRHSQHTSQIELGRVSQWAFARNPMTVANIGWDLQAYSRGRFFLGLGSQIPSHIEKRFSMPLSHPLRPCVNSSWRSGRSGRRGGMAPRCASRVSSTPTRS